MASRRGNTDAFSLFAFQDIITSVTGIMILITLLFSLELTRKTPVQANASHAGSPPPKPQNLKMLEYRVKSLQAIFADNQILLEKVAAMPAAEIASLVATLKERLAALKLTSDEISSSNQRLNFEAAQKSEKINQLQEQDLSSLEEQIRRLEQEIQSTSNTAVVVYNPDPAASKTAWLIDLGETKIQAFPISGGQIRSFPVSASGEVPTEFTTWVRQRDNSQEYFVLLLRPESVVLYDKLHPLLDGMGFELGFDLIDSNTDARATLSE